MGITILPKTRMGLLSLLFVLLSLFLLVLILVVPSRIAPTGFESLLLNPFHTFAAVLGLFLVVGSPVLGLYSVVVERERSVLVFLVLPFLIIGPLMALFFIFSVFFSG